MKKILLRIITGLLLTTIVEIAISQHDFREGYIVTLKNDTVYGLIDFSSPQNNARQCFFREDSLSEVRKHTPYELSAYAFNNSKYYISKRIPFADSSQLFYLEYLIDGIINLYYFNDLGEDQYFIEKDDQLYPLTNEKTVYKKDGKNYKKESKKYIGTLKWLMQDANQLFKEIDKTDFNHLSLIQTTQDYHDMVCDDKECIVYYKKQKKLNDSKWRIGVGVSIEYIYTKVEMSTKFSNNTLISSPGHHSRYVYVLNNTNAHFTSGSGSFVPGLLLNINRNNRTSFQIEVKYYKVKAPLIEFTKLKIPVLFNYELMYYENPKPFISVGVVSDYYLNTSVGDLYFDYDKLEINDQTDDLEYVSYSEYIQQDSFNNNRNFNLTLSLGCGVKYNFSEKNAIKLEIRTDVGSGKKYSFYLDSGTRMLADVSQNTLQVLMSYTF